MQALLADGKARLLTRKALDWTDKFRPVAQALAKLDAVTEGQPIVLDGLAFGVMTEEAVALSATRSCSSTRVDRSGRVPAVGRANPPC